MAPVQDQQLEKLVDGALKNSNFQALDDFLQEDIDEGTALTFSKQFLTKLDKLINRGLDHKEAKHASLGLTILYKCGKNLSLSGGQGLSEVVAQGLVKKWFEKCRQLWINGGPQRNQTLLNLAEDFFDSLMVVHEVSKEGTYQVTESLLYPIGQLVADPRIYIMIQKEAIRKFNVILDKIPIQLKKEKRILSSQEASDVMVKLAGQILDGGDYDLQTALMEALCRMSLPGQRKELARRWFTMEYVASAFSKIQDSEFETDCRKFLNLVNGMQGDRKRIYSYPCLEAYLDKHELLMPSDENLEGFWIDFNLGSQSISFYFALADEEAQHGQWDAICITENEVKSYTVTEEAKSRVLRLKLSEPVCVGVLEGSSLTIHFSSSLDILQAARRVYGHSKNKSFVGKSGTSVVKTTVKIIMDDSCSQVIVPESQTSSITDTEKERNTAPSWLLPPPAPLQMVTPARRRVSESSTVISSTRSSVHGASPFTLVMPATTPNRVKVKPALEMISSCEKQGQLYLGQMRTSTKTHSHSTSSGSTKTDSRRDQVNDLKQDMRNMTEKYRKNIPVDKVVEILQAEQEEEQEPLDHSFVPDSQPNKTSERSISSHWNKLSISEMLMVSRQRNRSLTRHEPVLSLEQQQERPSSAQRSSVPGSGPISHNKLLTELTQRLQEVLQERKQTPGRQELAGSKGKRPEDRVVSQTRGNVDQCSSTEHDPKESQQQPAGRQPRARGRSQGQRSQETEPVRAPVKPTPTNVLQERTTPNPEVKATGTLSSKEKRDAEVASSMVKLISSHYESNTSFNTKVTDANIPLRWVPPFVKRSHFERSWLPSAKKEAPKGIGFMKSYSNPRKTFKEYGEDVFAFNPDTSMSSGGKGKKSTESSAIDSSGIQDSWALPSATKKGQPVAKQGKRYLKKHLFSDTDTDCATAEVSWLRESSRKPKPKVTDYTREAPTKTKAPAPDTTYESPDIPPLSPTPVKEKAKPNKKKPRMKETVEKPLKAAAAPSRTAGRRPQRAAAATTKSYIDPDTSDSQSETEQLPAPKKRVMSQQRKSEKICQEVAEIRKKKTAPNTCRELYNDRHESQSETEQPPTPKMHVMGQQKESEKVCPNSSEVKKKNATTKQPTKSHKELEYDSHNSLLETEQPPALKKRVMGPPEKSEKEVAEVRKKSTAPNTCREVDSDSHESQSETEQLPTPKKRVMGQQEKREKICQDVAQLKKKKIAPTKQPANTYKELDNDSKSESELPGAPKQRRVMGQQEKREKICQDVAQLKKKTAPTKQPTNTYKELDNDSKSESELPGAPKQRRVMGQQEKREKICQDVAQLKKKTAPTKQPTNTYKELDNDSKSESELPGAPKKRSGVQQGKSEKTYQEATEFKKKKITSAKKQTSVQEDSWATRLASLSPSPPPIERMRSAKRSPSTLVQPLIPLVSPLPASPVPRCQDTPLPILELPEPPQSVASSKGVFPPSFFSAGRRSNVSKSPSLTSKFQTPLSYSTKRPSVAGLSPIPRPFSPAAQSPLSQSSPPQLTSTALNLEKSPITSLPQLQFSQTPLDTLSCGLHYGSGKESLVTLSQSSSAKSEVPTTTTRVEANPTAALALANQLEVTPCDGADQYFVSGPIRKRHKAQPSLSNSEEDEREGGKKGKRRGQLSIKMRPRKLFKSSTKPHACAQSWGDKSSAEEEEKKGSGPTDGAFRAAKTGYGNIQKKSTSTTTRDTVVELSPEGEVSRMVSVSHMVSSDCWEAEMEDGDGDVELPDMSLNPHDICHHFSSELQRKFQSRSKRMELYTKQSLKTVQQHVSSMGIQISKYRTQRLEQTQSALMEEINSLEQDDTALKNMEKELTIYWRKQTVAFHSYHEKETRRLEKLKSAFQDNVCYSLENEERIFTSQMCLMRKDMKSVQDKLFKEMHEEELQNVRRGLQALFLPEGPRF